MARLPPLNRPPPPHPLSPVPPPRLHQGVLPSKTDTAPLSNGAVSEKEFD